MSIPTFTVVPSSLRPLTFSQDMDQLLSELNPWTQALNEKGNAFALGLSATSATNLTLSAGVKNLAIQNGKGFGVGMEIVIASTAAPTNRMIGTVTAYNATTGVLAVNVSSSSGSGTVAAWVISVTSATDVSNFEPKITKSLGFAKWTGTAWAFDASDYIPSSAIGISVQGYDADLAAIAALAGSAGLLRKTGLNTWSLDITSYQTQQAVTGIVKSAGTTRSAAVAGTDFVAPGGSLGMPTSGDLSACTADGTNPPGFRNIPQVSKSTAYTCVLSDAGKHLLHPSADTTARTFTIPANAAVAYPIGTALTFICQNGAGPITISINSDTLRWVGSGITGSRTLGGNGIATAIKVAASEWMISGVNLT